MTDRQAGTTHSDMPVVEAPTRPALRWHGGKWLLAPWIIAHFPEHRVYTEVYGGAASVLLRKLRSYAEIYNDLDGDVVSLFRVLRDPAQGQELRRRLELTPFAREEFKNSYQPTEDPVEQARRLVIRSFMGFGTNAASGKGFQGGFRCETDRKWLDCTKTGFRAASNLSGTTPAHDWVNYPNCLEAITKRFRAVVIEQRPALEVLEQHDKPMALHYVDPPYVHATRKPRQHKNYTHEMTDQDHRDLAGVLKGLKGMVVLSGYPSDLYAELYGYWHQVTRAARADGARKRVEVLWLNQAAWDRMPQGRLV